jgi:DNA-binding transcriptional ArsR family regulator
MLRRLARRELTVGEFARPLDMSLAAVSKHSSYSKTRA